VPAVECSITLPGAGQNMPEGIAHGPYAGSADLTIKAHVLVCYPAAM